MATGLGVQGDVSPFAHDRAHAVVVEVLGPAVRQRRRALGLTQQEVADLADCARRSVHALEQGKATLRLDTLLSIVGVLGLRLRLERGRGPVTTADDLAPPAGPSA